MKIGCEGYLQDALYKLDENMRALTAHPLIEAPVTFVIVHCDTPVGDTKHPWYSKGFGATNNGNDLSLYWSLPFRFDLAKQPRSYVSLPKSMVNNVGKLTYLWK